MQKAFLCLYTYVSFISLPLQAFIANPGISGSFDFGPGYRRDNVHWSIAAPSGTPDVFTEVNWEALHIGQIMARGHLTAWDHLYIRGSADWGWVICGDNEVSYFAADDRKDEFSHFNCTANNGTVGDLSGGIGVNLFPWNRSIELAPLVGFSFHEQHLTMENGNQTIAPDPAVLGGIQGLKTKYRNRWRGPWLGVDFSMMVTCNLKIEASFEYHWVCYSARGEWRIRKCKHKHRGDTTPSVSSSSSRHRRDLFLNKYTQDAHGRGLVGNCGISYTLSKGWGIGLYGQMGKWTTSNGTNNSNLCRSFDNLDAAHQFVGTFPIISSTRLNRVTWYTTCVTFEFDALF